jgi:hypothetical protein
LLCLYCDRNHKLIVSANLNLSIRVVNKSASSQLIRAASNFTKRATMVAIQKSLVAAMQKTSSCHTQNEPRIWDNPHTIDRPESGTES